MNFTGLKIKQRYLLLLFSFLFCFSAYAQTKQINGVVVDEQKQPIIGATVLVKGTSNGTSTDFDGRFTLNVADDAVLNVSYVGYSSIEVKATENMTIVLKEQTEMLEEFVVIGYGTVKKSDATGSVTAIEPDEFNKGLQAAGCARR